MSLRTSLRDWALMESLSAGNADAFWFLWKRHEPHLLEICFRQMKHVRADAEDAVSRSMLVARDKLPIYAREIIDVEAWLTRLTCNVCLDMKKERSRGTKRVQTLDEAVLVRREPTVAVPRSPEEHYVSAQTLSVIGEAIEALPGGLRDAAMLRFIHEEGYPEIASRLAITEANARKRVQLARALLNQRLRPVLQAPRRVEAEA
jgi:RNA polymerase sigma factor (sigma-70 family)